jgi:hypothetical protein
MMVGTEKAMARILDLARSELRPVGSDRHANALIESTTLVNGLQDEIESLRAKLAQPDQEPSLWVDEFGNIEPSFQPWMQDEIDRGVNWVPLYLHPKGE